MKNYELTYEVKLKKPSLKNNTKSSLDVKKNKLYYIINKSMEKLKSKQQKYK